MRGSFRIAAQPSLPTASWRAPPLPRKDGCGAYGAVTRGERWRNGSVRTEVRRDRWTRGRSEGAAAPDEAADALAFLVLVLLVLLVVWTQRRPIAADYIERRARAARRPGQLYGQADRLSHPAARKSRDRRSQAARSDRALGRGRLGWGLRRPKVEHDHARAASGCTAGSRTASSASARSTSCCRRRPACRSGFPDQQCRHRRRRDRVSTRPPAGSASRSKARAISPTASAAGWRRRRTGSRLGGCRLDAVLATLGGRASTI